MTHLCIEPRPERELELALFAGGDLTAEESAAIESHLAACPACRDLVRELRESHAGLAALADEPIDPDALTRIRHAVRRRIEEEEVAAAGREERRPVWLLPLAAGLVLVLLAAAVWLRSQDRGSGTGPSPQPPQVAEVPPAAVEVPDTAPPPDVPTASPPEEPETATRPAPEPVRQARAETPAPVETADRPPTEPMVIQVVSDDPDIVFYWLVEPEETQDETVSS